MHPYNQRQIEQRLKRKRQLEALRKKMSVKEIAAKFGVTRQAIEKAMK